MARSCHRTLLCDCELWCAVTAVTGAVTGAVTMVCVWCAAWCAAVCSTTGLCVVYRSESGRDMVRDMADACQSSCYIEGAAELEAAAPRVCTCACVRVGGRERENLHENSS